VSGGVAPVGWGELALGFDLWIVARDRGPQVDLPSEWAVMELQESTIRRLTICCTGVYPGGGTGIGGAAGGL